MTKYATANHAASSVNAFGTASATKNTPSIAPKMKSRVGMFSTSIASVIQAYADHAHHTSANTSAARANPSADVSSRTSVVTCVNANTNTRSKKSSMKPVRFSSSAAVTGAVGSTTDSYTDQNASNASGSLGRASTSVTAPPSIRKSRTCSSSSVRPCLVPRAV